MNIGSRYQCVRLFFLTVLVAVLTFGGFGGSQLNASAQASTCESGVNITGVYQCTSECIIKENGRFSYRPPEGGETDTVRDFAWIGSKDLYVVDIEASGFHETEIGPLVDSKLWTATSEVSDGKFPVLEEYVFNCNNSPYFVDGFTKVVRNPSQENFKSCIVKCTR